MGKKEMNLADRLVEQRINVHLAKALPFALRPFEQLDPLDVQETGLQISTEPVLRHRLRRYVDPVDQYGQILRLHLRQRGETDPAEKNPTARFVIDCT